MAVLKSVSARMACGAKRAVGEDARARQALVALAQAFADCLRVAYFPTKYLRGRLAVVREVPVDSVVFEVAEHGRMARLGPRGAVPVVGRAAVAFWRRARSGRTLNVFGWRSPDRRACGRERW